MWVRSDVALLLAMPLRTGHNQLLDLPHNALDTRRMASLEPWLQTTEGAEPMLSISSTKAAAWKLGLDCPWQAR